MSARSLLLASMLGACAHPARPALSSATPSPTTATCPTSLRAMVPAGASSWVVARPRAILAHPRLGRALGRAFDDAGDQALFERARRVGYDVRTVERALVAWRGPTTVAVGLGAFDTRRIDTLLWDRMLPPRERAEGDGVLRAWGVVGATPTALAIWNTCSLVSWAEGPALAPLRAIEQTLRARGGVDDDALATWRGETVPAELRDRTPDALLEGVRGVELRALEDPRGVRVRLRLEGALPTDAEARLRRALDALIEEPIGHAVGAAQWLRGERVTVTQTGDGIDAEALIPWAAIDALADVLRGRVAEGPTGL